ncbi:MAG: hypothetical protein IPK66_18860 [Rhodospirillales bacterium]|nr:hypothetical protein [Rhodospirillales bacterium]
MRAATLRVGFRPLPQTTPHCTGEIENGRYTLRQDTNAYAVLPAECWDQTAAPPQPEAGTWGDQPPLPSALDAAIQVRCDGSSVEAIAAELARNDDGSDPLVGTLLGLWRALKEREAPGTGRPGFPGCSA